jgi:mycofactocin system creatininase family protein
VTSLDRAAWPELAGRDDLTLVVPLGSCEQHGPHLPFDVDTCVASAVAATLEGVVLGPAVPYGASGEHEGFPGTVSIGTEALHLLLVELGRSAARWAARVLLVNAHGGNAAAVVGAVRQLRAEGRDVAWWPCAMAGSDAHAGRTETSILLSLSPSRVGAFRPVGRTEPVGALMSELRAGGVAVVSPNGVLGDPTGASAAEGDRLLAGLRDRLRSDLNAWQVGHDGRLGR